MATKLQTTRIAGVFPWTCFLIAPVAALSCRMAKIIVNANWRDRASAVESAVRHDPAAGHHLRSHLSSWNT